MQGITNNDLAKEETWLQTTLPVERGGLEIGRAALLAFMVSVGPVRSVVMQIFLEDDGNVAEVAMKTRKGVPQAEPLLDFFCMFLSAAVDCEQSKARVASSNVEGVCWPDKSSSRSAFWKSSGRPNHTHIALRLRNFVVRGRKCIVCGTMVKEDGYHGLARKFSS